MNTKHTPGTWLIDGMHIIGNGYSIAHINSHRTTEGRANASLIASAPKMFDLLVELIDMEGPQPGNSGWANRVKSLVSEVAGD